MYTSIFRKPILLGQIFLLLVSYIPTNAMQLFGKNFNWIYSTKFFKPTTPSYITAQFPIKIDLKHELAEIKKQTQYVQDLEKRLLQNYSLSDEDKNGIIQLYKTLLRAEKLQLNHPEFKSNDISITITKLRDICNKLENYNREIKEIVEKKRISIYQELKKEKNVKTINVPQQLQLLPKESLIHQIYPSALNNFYFQKIVTNIYNAQQPFGEESTGYADYWEHEEYYINFFVSELGEKYNWTPQQIKQEQRYLKSTLLKNENPFKKDYYEQLKKNRKTDPYYSQEHGRGIIFINDELRKFTEAQKAI